MKRHHPDHYSPPQTIEEARARITEATAARRDLELKLTSDARNYPHADDRRRIRSAMQHFDNEIRALKAWLGEKTVAENEQRRAAKEERRQKWHTAVDEAQRKEVGGVVEMLRELYAVNHGIVSGGRVAYTECEQDVLDSVRDFLNAWDYAREPLDVGAHRRGSLRSVVKETSHG